MQPREIQGTIKMGKATAMLFLTVPMFILFLLGSHENIIRLCNIYLKLDSNASFIYEEKGKRLQNLNKFEESIKCFKKALKSENGEINLHDHFNLLNNIGYSFEQLSNLDKAKKYYNKSLNIKSNYYSWMALGRIYFKEKKYDLALDNINKSLEFNPEYVYSNSLKINILTKTNNLNEATDYVNQCIEKYPDVADYWFRKANILEEKKEYKRAIEYYKKSKTLSWDDNTFNPDAMIALTYRKICSYNEALIFFDKAFKKEPTFILTLMKAITLCNLEKYDESLKTVNNVLKAL